MIILRPKYFLNRCMFSCDSKAMFLAYFLRRSIDALLLSHLKIKKKNEVVLRLI